MPGGRPSVYKPEYAEAARSLCARGAINETLAAQFEVSRSTIDRWIAAIPDFLSEATAAVRRAAPGARPVSFGHIGDGHIHFNFSFPLGEDGAAFIAKRAEIARIVHDIVAQFHGSFSAEHGVGVMKRDELLRYKSAAEIAVMRALKHTLDPKNILNPGKMFAVP